MALINYQIQTRRLLQNPAEPTAFVANADIDNWINIARGQLAGEAECVRFLGTLTTVPAQVAYNFSAISTGASSANGIQGIIHIRSILYAVGATLQGRQWIPSRPWEWFQLFHMNNPVPLVGPPVVWSQFAQGAAPSGAPGSGPGGSFYIDPPPDLAYNLYLDCVCYPIPLVDDTTIEAIPYLWTDAVPFFAAYYSLLSSITKHPNADAYFGYYQQFVQRARQAANPSVNRYQYEQAGDPAMMNKLGMSQKAAGGQ